MTKKQSNVRDHTHNDKEALTKLAKQVTEGAGRKAETKTNVKGNKIKALLEKELKQAKS